MASGSGFIRLVLGFALSCLPIISIQAQHIPDQLYLYQDGVESLVKKKSISVSKNNFALRFYLKDYSSKSRYSARLAAFTDKKDLSYLKEGVSILDISYFEPGSGMAPDRSGRYESLIFNNNGHHYLIYEDESSKRVKLLEDQGDYKKVEFEISSLFFYHQRNQSYMTDTDLDEFYLAIFFDRNLNEIIDEGELRKLTVKIR